MLRSLAGVGVETWIGHRPDAIQNTDLIVASSAVPSSDPELAAASAAGIEVWERPRLLQVLSQRLGTIGVTGTHGKTTTTAMMVTALRSMDRDPSFMVGGRLIDLNTNAHLGEESLFVLEADEAFGTFLDLSLDALLITNIEADHLDFYGTVEAMEGAYVDVASRVSGPVVGCIDDPGVQRLAGEVDGLIGYGSSAAATWRLESVTREGIGVRASIAHHDDRFDLVVPKPGLHVALNALGVVAFGAALGFDPGLIAAGLTRFNGVRRRFEVRARLPELTIVDDYAHHPTEVAATLEAARSGHEGRILAVFQPHRYSRTAEHGSALGRALSAADVVVVADVYAAGEVPIPGVTGRLVASAIEGAETRFVARRADLAAEVVSLVEPGDLVLLLGAGDVTGAADEILTLLQDS